MKTSWDGTNTTDV